MMAERSISIKGSAELMRALKKLDEAAQAKNLELAAVAGAKKIQNAAKSLAPKKTRTLVRSIHIGGHTDPDFGKKDADNEGNAPYSDLGQNKATDQEAEVVIGTNLVYAAQREFGGTITAKKAEALHWVDAVGEHHFAKSVTQAAHPFLRPAFDEKQQAAVDAAKQVLRFLILKAGQE